MQTKQLFIITAFVVTILLFDSCHKEGKDTPAYPPDSVTLSSPANNTACLKSSSINGNLASVTFIWKNSNKADSYRLDIQNLNTQNITSYNTTNTSYTTSLDMDTPYSWSIVVINSAGKTTSDVWKFYLSGTASSNYAPFPADLVSPFPDAVVNTNGTSTVEITFQWTGSDPDNDIATYALFLDNTDASTQIIASQSETTAKQNLASGKTYYWKVITTDKAGNKSVSAVHSFQIK
jgi:hypothetical protein